MNMTLLVYPLAAFERKKETEKSLNPLCCQEPPVPLFYHIFSDDRKSASLHYNHLNLPLIFILRAINGQEIHQSFSVIISISVT